MTFLPIVERELRVAARKKGTHWLWFFAAVAAMLAVFLVMFFNSPSTSQSEIGPWVFHTISTIAFGFSLLAGVFLTSDCLCSERRDGTLGLLFLTDLKGYDVVLGKLVATSIVSVYALLAVIPMLGLPLLMGGVTFGEFARKTLALLATMFLSLSTGLLASALCRETRAAMVGGFAVVLGLTGGIFGAGWAVYHLLGWKPAECLMVLSPVGSFMLSHALEYGKSWYTAGYWVSLGFGFTLGLAQLVAASRLLPRVWQTAGLEGIRREESVRPPRGVAEGNPFQWLLERDNFPDRVVATGFITLFLIWCCLPLSVFFVHSSDQDEMMLAGLAGAMVLHVLAKCLLAVQATRRFSEDHRSGALELLLTTPIEVRTILDAQRIVLKRQFQRFQTALLGVNLALILSLMIHPRWRDWEPVVIISTMCVGGSVLWLVDAHALRWVGMSMALRGPHHVRATLKTLGRVLGLPWLGFLIFMLLTRGPSGGAEVFAIWLIWFAFSVISAGMAGIKHENQLRNDFRRLAAGDEPRQDSEAYRPWSPEWETPAATTTPPAA